jgi:hypothetical protein
LLIVTTVHEQYLFLFNIGYTFTVYRTQIGKSYSFL